MIGKVISQSMSMIKTTVLDEVGRSVSLALRKDLTVEQAKTQAIAELSLDKCPTSKTIQQYKLVSRKSGRSLNDVKRLQDEKLHQNDELLLLRRNVCDVTSAPTEQSTPKGSTADEEKYRAPTLQEIALATNSVAPVEGGSSMGIPPPRSPQRNEVRKIMVTLVEYSELLLRDHPDIKPIFVDLRTKMEEPFEIREPPVNPDLVNDISDMGFDKEQARRALMMKKCKSKDALEVLLSGDCDDILSDYLFTLKISKVPKAYAMLKCYQEYRRKLFTTSTQAVENLKAMGFTENEVIDALRIYSNDQEAACNWLLSDRQATPEHFARGLDPEGVIYRAIVANPVVQLGLCTPKVLVALLQILENPHFMTRWITDSDTAPLLSHLFRTYHSEKASLRVR